MNRYDTIIAELAERVPEIADECQRFFGRQGSL